MKFTRYRSIENSYRQKFIEKIVFEGYRDEVYCATEKIHGCNFSFHITKDGDSFSIKGAKRSQYLSESSNFNNWQIIRDHLKYRLIDLYGYIAESDEDCVSVFGEICGGSYPHPDVERCEGATRVQKEVFYSPDNKFIAFDVCLNDEYLPWETARELLIKNDIPKVDLLFVGTLNECLAQSNEFQTTIPGYFDLPEIEGNICEGTVIKPYLKSLELLDGKRIILKNKNEKFSEKGATSKKAPKELPENVSKMVTEMSKYVTEQRLNNVLSKLDEVSMSDFGMVIGLMNKDIMDDFVKDFEDDLNDLEKVERKQIGKYVGRFSAPLIKKYFMENI